MEENITKIIEGILFALGREISCIELSSTLQIEEEEIQKAIQQLEQKYNENESIVLVKVKGMYQLVTNKNLYKYVNLFVENTKRQNLSTSALETLTIIAYNPKITKTEIENIRGVNSDFAVNRLLECGLVEEVARLNLPGRPAAYSVTNDFLKSCNLQEINELPNFEDIRIKDEQMLVNDYTKKNNDCNKTESIENQSIDKE